MKNILYLLLGLLSFSQSGEARVNRYRYYLDPRTAEETLSSITLPERMSGEAWKKVLAERSKRKGKNREIASENYTVKTGDNLWRISEVELGNPRLWPKLWQVNSSLANPHEIEPGRHLDFITVEQAETPGNKENDPPPIRIPVVKLLPSGKVNSANDLDKDTIVNVDIKNRFRVTYFVLGEEEILGEITGSYSENRAFAELDSVYIEAEDPKERKVGERLAVVRAEKLLRDPSRENTPVIGTLMRLLGEVEITESGEKYFKADIKGMYSPFTRGDKLMSVRKALNWSAAFQPPPTLTAKVLMGEEPAHRLFQQGSMVVLNKGRKDGMSEGFLFRIYQSRDPHTKKSSNVDPGYKGELQVVYVSELSSVAYILRNTDVIAIGDDAIPKQAFKDRPVSKIKQNPTVEIN